MTHQNEMSDKQIADHFNKVRIADDTDTIYSQRCMISLIASKLTDFSTALPLLAKATVHDMRGLCDMAQASNENNTIGYLEQNGYSAALAYQFVMSQREAAEAA